MDGSNIERPHQDDVPPTTTNESLQLLARVRSYLASHEPMMPIDENQDQSRPSSALSGGSSFTNESNADSLASITNREIGAIRSRDKRQCALCGRKDAPLEVIRISWAHEDQPFSVSLESLNSYEPSVSHVIYIHKTIWLQALRVLPEDTDQNDPDNLITCKHFQIWGL